MVNKVILIGRLGIEPQVKDKIVAFTLATGKEKTLCWHNIICFDRLMETAQNLAKGQLVFVEGAINNRSYTDKAGVTRKVSEILASRLFRCGGDENEKAKPKPKINEGPEEDELPF